jgi:A1 cistron-splicing factor AAR2
MCLDNGDCFIIIGLPDRFTVGLDTIALTTSNGKEFRGFRDIPPGPHFLWMSEPGAISRCGYWFVSGEHGEVRVKQWDRYNEVLGDAASQVEVREQEQSIEETYPSLMPHNFQGDAASTIAAPPPPPKDGPRRGSNPDPDPDPEFTADNITIWRQLTSAITPAFLSRVTGRRTVTEWLVDTTDGAKGDIRFQEPTRLVKSIVGSQLDFLFQQDIIDLQLLNIAAGNQSNSDTTPRVLALLRSSGSTQNPTSSDDDTPSPRPITENDILAELQFIFLTGLHLGNYTCLEQWWHLLLKIIIRAHALVLSRPALVRHFLRTLHAQMVYNDRYIDHAAAAAAAASSTPGYSSGGGGEEEQPSTHSSILETIPRNKARLRDALTVYKRRLNQALLAEQSNLSAEQGAVGHAFADLEAWFWRYGWDLRSDYVEAAEEEEGVATRTTITVGGGSGGGRGGAAGFDDSDSEADDYAPVVVQLDEHGREVGLVSFND